MPHGISGNPRMSDETKGKIKRLFIVLWVIASYLGAVIMLIHSVKSVAVPAFYWFVGIPVGFIVWAASALVGIVFILIGKWIWTGKDGW